MEDSLPVRQANAHRPAPWPQPHDPLVLRLGNHRRHALVRLLALPVAHLIDRPTVEEADLVVNPEPPRREPPPDCSADSRVPTPAVRVTAALVIPRVVDALHERAPHAGSVARGEARARSRARPCSSSASPEHHPRRPRVPATTLFQALSLSSIVIMDAVAFVVLGSSFCLAHIVSKKRRCSCADQRGSGILAHASRAGVALSL